MTDLQWTPARIIPTSGINGAREQETRATSALLAVLTVVPDFAKALLGPLNAPSGILEAFLEVPFAHGTGKAYPDGLLRVTGRRGASWTALVEVKTGTNPLEFDQIEKYISIAKAHSIDAVITISNQIPPQPNGHPLTFTSKQLRGVELHHLPWSSVLAAAIIQKEHRGLADQEQAWILGELIAYLEHAKSGALEFSSMGPYWTKVRDAVIDGTFRITDTHAAETVSNFDALLSYVAIRLSQKFGRTVSLALSKAERQDPALRQQALLQELRQSGTLSGALRFQDLPQPLTYIADFRAGRLSLCAYAEADTSARQVTRVRNLVKQLSGAGPSLRIESYLKNRRGSQATELLSVLREAPEKLILEPDKELRGFDVVHSQTVGYKNGTGKGCFITSLVDLTDEFYATVITALTPKEQVQRDEHSFTAVDMTLFEGLDYRYSKMPKDAAPEDARVRIFDSHSNEMLSKSARRAYICYVSALCSFPEYRAILLEHRNGRRTFFNDPATLTDDDSFQHIVDDDIAFYTNHSRLGIASNLKEIGDILGMAIAIEDVSPAEILDAEVVETKDTPLAQSHPSRERFNPFNS